MPILLPQDAFIDERANRLTDNRKKWETMMGSRREREEDYLKMRFRRVDDHEGQLDALRTHDTEEYNMVKIKLETDVQILEQQLQQMKATYQLNQEKLEYNFQVLKKRDEENTITKSQQKRKITRLQDVVNGLRLKLNKQEKHYKEENQSLVDEYKRIADQYKELHKKMRHFGATDWKKFQDIWNMNEEEVKNLVQQVLQADQTIHEQQLALPWNPPDLPFFKSNGPLNVPHVDPTKTATAYVKELIASDQASTATSEDKEAEASPAESSLTLGSVKKLLEILCDEAGFLVEEKLNKLLLPLQSDERSLIKLDAIFKALNIDTEEDVKKLSAFFQKFDTKATPVGNDVDDGSLTSEDKEVQQLDLGGVTEGISIHHNQVLEILREFVKEHIIPVKEVQKTTASTLQGSLSRDSTHDAAFWESMSSVIDDRKLQMWEALIEALTKYHTTLTERAVRIRETDALRQQNAELRMLLHQYISSKVNQELEIPPTRVLQLEYN